MTLNEGTTRDDSCVSCVCVHNRGLPNAPICVERDGKVIRAFLVDQSTFTQNLVRYSEPRAHHLEVWLIIVTFSHAVELV